MTDECTSTKCGGPSAEEFERELFAFLQGKYVQRADERQRAMGLVYMTAVTDDLARETARFLSRREAAERRKPDPAHAEAMLDVITTSTASASRALRLDRS